MSTDSEDTFWPVVPEPQRGKATLYKGYKRLITKIAEKLRKSEILNIAYEHDLPVWYSEVGAAHEPSYTLRVLSLMEGRQLFSPTNLAELSDSLHNVGRVDLAKMVNDFERDHRSTIQETLNPRLVVDSPCNFDRHRNGLNYSYHHHPPVHLSPEAETVDDYTERAGSLKLKHHWYIGQSKSQPTSRSASRSGSRRGSLDQLLDNGRPGTPYETVSDYDGPVTNFHRGHYPNHYNHSNSTPVNHTQNGYSHAYQDIPTIVTSDVQLSIRMVQYSAKMLSDQIQSLKQTLSHRCSARPKLHGRITESYFLTHQLTSCLSLLSDELHSPDVTSPPIDRHYTMPPTDSMGVVHLKSHSYTSDIDDTLPFTRTLPLHHGKRSNSQPLLFSTMVTKETSAPPTDAMGEDEADFLESPQSSCFSDNYIPRGGEHTLSHDNTFRDSQYIQLDQLPQGEHRGEPPLPHPSNMPTTLKRSSHVIVSRATFLHTQGDDIERDGKSKMRAKSVESLVDSEKDKKKTSTIIKMLKPTRKSFSKKSMD